MTELSDEELQRKLEQLVKAEREGLAEFLIHLNAFDLRRVAAKRSFPSTFEYCTRKLGLTADEAYRRIHVARKSRTHPGLVEMIRDGKLSLSAATKIAPALNETNRKSLLEQAAGKTVREVEAIVALQSPVAQLPGDVVHVLALEAQAGAPPQLAYRVSITLSQEAHAKLRRAIDLLRHRIPGGEPHVVVEAALDALLDDVDRDRKPPSRATEVAPGGRRIPEWVKDAAWARDGGRCAWTDGGERCGSRAWLQYDHVVPFARGGVSDDPLNVRLLCGAHNRHAARLAGLTRPSTGSNVEA